MVPKDHSPNISQSAVPYLFFLNTHNSQSCIAFLVIITQLVIGGDGTMLEKDKKSLPVHHLFITV